MGIRCVSFRKPADPDLPIRSSIGTQYERKHTLSHCLECIVRASPSVRFDRNLVELVADESASSSSRVLVRPEGIELGAEDLGWVAAEDASGIRICDSGFPLPVWDDLPAALAVRIANLVSSAPLSFPAALLRDRKSVVQSSDLFSLLAEAIDDGADVETRVVSGQSQWRVSLAPASSSSKAQLSTAAVESVQCPESSPSRDQSVAWECVVSGLLQMNDHLDRSHEYSQSIEGQGQHVTGDYWHGIMHRREPDFGNSGYWFRRVGHHPVFDELVAIAPQILARHPERPEASGVVTGGHWSPMAMIDLCQAAVTTRDPKLTAIAEDLQWAEMLLLLRFSWRQFVS